MLHPNDGFRVFPLSFRCSRPLPSRYPPQYGRKASGFSAAPFFRFAKNRTRLINLPSPSPGCFFLLSVGLFDERGALPTEMVRRSPPPVPFPFCRSFSCFGRSLSVRRALSSQTFGAPPLSPSAACSGQDFCLHRPSLKNGCQVSELCLPFPAGYQPLFPTYGRCSESIHPGF